MTADPRELLLLLDDQPPPPAPVRAVRRRIERRRSVLLAGTAVAAVLTTAGGATLLARPAPTPPVAEETAPDPVIVQDRGIRLTLALDKQQVELGDELTARVTVQNTTDRVQRWFSDGCRRTIDVAVDLQDVTERGRDWTGTEALFKRLAARDDRPQRGGFREMGAAAKTFCGDIGVFNELPAGATASSTLVWRARLPEGGRPAGPATVTASFDLVPDSLGSSVPVTATAPITVTGAGSLSRAEVVDAALSDTAFRQWLQAEPRPNWTNAFAFPDPDRDETWQVGLALEADGARGAGTVTVDGVTGDIVRRTLP